MIAKQESLRTKWVQPSAIAGRPYKDSYIGNGVDHNRVHTVIETELFSRKEVEEPFEDIAPGIAVGNMDDMLWMI